MASPAWSASCPPMPATPARPQTLVSYRCGGGAPRCGVVCVEELVCRMRGTMPAHTEQSVCNGHSSGVAAHHCPELLLRCHSSKKGPSCLVAPEQGAKPGDPFLVSRRSSLMPHLPNPPSRPQDFYITGMNAERRNVVLRDTQFSRLMAQQARLGAADARGAVRKPRGAENPEQISKTVSELQELLGGGKPAAGQPAGSGGSS